ncbi:hypothetical protein BC834DRAFT_849614 [Gloeopeniophorella convolvens]|nr:hypothetical protein BC834DRAFT_849614 [Gloeopeniophorella convolvens]
MIPPCARPLTAPYINCSTRACSNSRCVPLMSRLDTILNPQSDSISPLRAERVPSPHPTPSSPVSSISESSGTARPQTYAETREHRAHPGCPDTLCCLPDTDGRPQHTLPVILRCAILGSNMKRLTIREIYAAMEEKYPYYKTAGSTWKQSVRHHLSLNRLFERQPRPVTDPGFGSYWTVNLEAPPGTKRPRKRGRPQRDTNGDSETPPAKKRGRPRKAPETERQTEQPPIATLPIPSMEHVGGRVSVSAVRIGSHRSYEDEDEDQILSLEQGMIPRWRAQEDLESEDDSDGQPQRPVTPPYDRAVAVNPGASPSLGTIRPLQDNLTSDAFPESIIDHLRVQMGMLRRQTSEARSDAASLSQQLADCQTEVSRFKAALKKAEDAAEAEAQKRKQAETHAEEEVRKRRAAEDELRTWQQQRSREPEANAT